MTVTLLLLLAPQLLEWLGMSSHYLPLFYIDLIGVSIQVVFMALLNVFFYIDKRAIVLERCILFVVLNAALTLLSIYMGLASLATVSPYPCWFVCCWRLGACPGRWMI